MSFKDMVSADLHGVFLNLGEFAEKRAVWIDGEVFRDIPVVLHGLKDNDRKKLTSGLRGEGGRSAVMDRLEGIFSERLVFHAASSDIGGRLPEVGRQIRISTDASGMRFRTYRVTASVLDMGMVRCELEAMTE